MPHKCKVVARVRSANYKKRARGSKISSVLTFCDAFSMSVIDKKQHDFECNLVKKH